MRNPARILGQAVFGAMVLGSLGLGTAHALTSADPAARSGARAYCEPLECNEACQRAGYQGGYCHVWTSCVCWR